MVTAPSASLDSMHDDRRLFSPSAERNRTHILPILQRVLPAAAEVLEVGSGTGEHAVYFCAHIAGLRWQPTDADPAAIDSILAWISHSALSRIAMPLELDLQSSVRNLLTMKRIEHNAEHRLDAKNRLDFYLETAKGYRIAVETKARAAVALATARQIRRYAPPRRRAVSQARQSGLFPVEFGAIGC